MQHVLQTFAKRSESNRYFILLHGRRKYGLFTITEILINIFSGWFRAQNDDFEARARRADEAKES